MRRPWLVALAVVALAAPARAQDTDQAAAAQALFEQGRALVEKGRFAEACPKLAESLRLDHGLGTMLWLADCWENDGKLASAWAQFKEAAALAALKKDKREKIARDRAAALEPKLPLVAIAVPPEVGALAGLEVKRDGVVVGKPEWGVALPLDPGPHEIAARAQGRKAWTSTITVAAGPGKTSVVVPMLDRDETASTTAPPPPQEPPREPPPPGASSGAGTQRLLGVVLAGVGVVGIGLGTYFGFTSKKTYDDSNAPGGGCVDNGCDPHGMSLRDKAHLQAAAATVAMIAGGVAIAGGAVLFFTASSGGGVAVAGRF